MTTLNTFEDNPDVYPKRIVYGPRQPYEKKYAPSDDMSWIMLAISYQKTWMLVDCAQGFKDKDVFSEVISDDDDGFAGAGIVLPELEPGVYLLTEIIVGGCQPNYWGDDWSDWEIEPKRVTKIALPTLPEWRPKPTTVHAVEIPVNRPTGG